MTVHIGDERRTINQIVSLFSFSFLFACGHRHGDTKKATPNRSPWSVSLASVEANSDVHCKKITTLEPEETWPQQMLTNEAV